MNHVEHETSTSTWVTASIGHSADMSPIEVSELSRHLTHCRVGAQRSLLRSAAQSLREFVAAHLVTTIITLAALALVIRFGF